VNVQHISSPCPQESRHQNFIESCEKIIAKLPPSRLELLIPLLKSDLDPVDDCRFWDVSEGVRGLMRRMGTSRTYVELIKEHVRDGRIELEDAQYIYKRIVLQAWFTLWAIPESLLCRIWSEVPHVAAQTALRFYSDIVLRSNLLCTFPGSPTCMLKLNKLF
jgi:hypothetical protein